MTSLFGLGGEDYWKNPWKDGPRLNREYVLDMRFGLYIDGPESVVLKTRKTLPVPFYYVATTRDDVRINLRALATITASRVEDRRVFLAPAYAPVDKVVDGPRLGGDSDDPISRQTVIDLFERLQIEEPGTYEVNVLLRDQISNRIEIKVVPPRIMVDDPEVQKFLEARRTPRIIPPPPAPSPELVAAPSPPPVPSDEGVVLSLERVTLIEEGAKALLQGSFRLTVRKDELVPPPAEGLPDYGNPRPSAVIPITLVALGSKSESPVVFRLNVPTFDRLGPDNMVATGTFAIDLFGSEDMTAEPQTHNFYAFAGAFFSGPHLFATVTKDMLPKPGE
jgi:hypothetical protein